MNQSKKLQANFGAAYKTYRYPKIHVQMNRGHQFQIGFHFLFLFLKENRQDPPIPQPIPTDTQFVSFWSPVRPSPVWNWTSLIDQDQLWWKRVTTIPSCWTNPYSTTSVPTPAAPPAPVADMHWQQHHFIAPAPEEEPPLPAAWPEAPPKAAAATAATTATTATTAAATTTTTTTTTTTATSATPATTATTATAAITASQQPTAHSRQAQQHWRPGGNRARDLLDMGWSWCFWWSSDFIVIYIICLCKELAHLGSLSCNSRSCRKSIIPQWSQCKSHASALMLMSGTYTTLTTDRGPPYLLMAYSPNK